MLCFARKYVGYAIVLATSSFLLSGVKVHYDDRNGEAERASERASILHKAKKNLNGRMFIRATSASVRKQFQSLGDFTPDQIGDIFTAVWKDVKHRVPGEFENLKMKGSNTIRLRYPNYMLVLDLDTVSLLYRNELIKRGVKNIPRKYWSEIRGYAMVQEAGQWVFGGFYDVAGTKYPMKDKEDEWGLFKKFATTIKK